MTLFSQINVRRICFAALMSLTLFVGSAFGIVGNSSALADVIQRSAIGATGTDTVDEAEYEMSKADRNQAQAMRSVRAEKEAEMKEGEGIVDKLNLDEVLPPAVEKALDLDD